MKKIIILVFFITVGLLANAQIRIVNDVNNSPVANSPAFIDASSNNTVNISPNVGKGLLFPRTDLSLLTSLSNVLSGNVASFPTRFDGMIVYNIKEGGTAGVGATEGTLTRGFWYYDNPTGGVAPTTLTTGTWRPLRGGGATVTANNGLTKTTSEVIQLGGSLIQATTITIGGQNFILNNTGSGVFRIVDNNQGAGKVLTSDASGNATWGVAPVDSKTVVTGTTPINVTNSTSGNTTTYNVAISPGSNGQVLKTTGGAVVWGTDDTGSSITKGNLTAAASVAAATAPIVVTNGASRLVDGNATLAVNNTAPLWNANKLQNYDISTNAPSNNQVLKWNGTAWTPANEASANSWLILGNDNTTATTNFLGTTNDQDLVFKRNGVNSGLLNAGRASTAFGVNALPNGRTNGTQNSAFGGFALRNNTSGNYNNAFGYQALYTNTTGQDNSAFGHNSLYYNNASNNSAFGVGALYRNSTASNNSAFGYQALAANTTETGNSAFGANALAKSNSRYNSAFGANALASLVYNANNDLAHSNSAFGYNAMNKTTSGVDNVAIGAWAMNENTTGGFNIAVGYGALRDGTRIEGNTAVGHNALYAVQGGSNNYSYNTAVGNIALRVLSSGADNVAIGAGAGAHMYNGNHYGMTSGSNNTYIGRDAGRGITSGTNYSGSNNILIGYNAQKSGATISNQVVIGNSSNNSYRIYGTWTNASDRRFKHNIQPLTQSQGLDFVLKLKPVSFVYNSKETGEKTIGFIAQDVQDVMKQANMSTSEYDLVPVMNEVEGTLGVNYTELIPVLTKAIQEQQEIIQKLEARIKVLEGK